MNTAQKSLNVEDERIRVLESHRSAKLLPISQLSLRVTTSEHVRHWPIKEFQSLQGYHTCWQMRLKMT